MDRTSAALGHQAAPKASTGPDQMHRRLRIVRTLVIVGVILLTLRLACVQLVWGPELAAQAQNQRSREYTDFARRGTVTDRDGAQLAYTMQARSLTVAPLVLRREIQERHDMAVDSGDPEQLAKFPPVEEVLDEMATVIPQMVRESGASAQKVKPAEILRKLQADNSYTVLVRNVDPDVAVDIAERFPGVAADRQDIRQYPNGAIAENVIGKISIDGEGQFGLEASSDGVLSGINGKSTEDVSTNGQIIPGTLRDQVPVVHGSDIELTLDLDLQTYVQQQLEQAKENSRAKSASAVVLDSATGEVLAMANTDTIDPTGDIERQLAKGRFFGNPAVQAPFEPGSVAKIITAAAAIEDGVTTPDEVLQVPGSIDMAGVTVKDAWPHGVVPFTTTGVFGKSSNVGTLMLADRVGQDRFAEMLDNFGVGRYTGIELPGESPGLLLDRSQWSGGTFANLPIGQGMSLTLLQMAGVYQTVANDGERIQPRIIRSVTTPDGETIEQPEPERVRVVSPETARTLRGMFQAVTQRDPSGVQQGTGPQAAVEGYQIAGKTGTAQQVNPDCDCYSNSDYWITFAGIAPADDPRFVIALMLDDPERGVHGEGGQSAAPLFHDIAAWLLNRDNVPLSPPREGDLILQAQ